MGSDQSSVEKGTKDLVQAAGDGQMDEVVATLAGSGAYLNLVDSSTGWCPLHAAIRNGRTEMVDYLLSIDGINVNVKGKASGKTALMLASDRGEAGLVNRLIKLGAKVNDINDDGWTALHVAALRNHVDVTSVLIRGNSDLDFTDSFGHSPLHVACSKGSAEVIQLLIEAGCNLKGLDRDGYDPEALIEEEGVRDVFLHAAEQRRIQSELQAGDEKELC